MNAVIDLVAGTIGGAAAVLIEHPFDTVKVLMQAGHYDGYVACARGVLAQGGLWGFYRGMSARLAASGFEHAIVFAAYKGTIRACGGDEEHPTLGQVALGGCGSGVASMICLTPFELVKCRMQADGPSPLLSRRAGSAAVLSDGAGVSTAMARTAHGGGALHHSTGVDGCTRQYRNSWDCARRTYQHGGIRELYRGGVATLYREIPGTAAWCGTYDFLKTRMTAPGQSPRDLPTWKLMLAGGASGVMFWSVMFPADVVKTRMQVDPGWSGLSFWQAVRAQYRESGWSGLYRGWALTAARSFPSNAVIFMCYDVVSRSLAKRGRAAGEGGGAM